MITFDDTNPLPAFEQVRSQIAAVILLGTLKNGQRLPTVRQLAADLRLAPGTIARAYAALEAEGLIETRGGGGTRVSVQAENHPEVLDAAVEYTGIARSAHLTLDQAILAVRAAWNATP